MATFAAMAGLKLPDKDRKGKPIIFDSYDMSPLLFGTGKWERNTWFYYQGLTQSQREDGLGKRIQVETHSEDVFSKVILLGPETGLVPEPKLIRGIISQR